VKDAATGRPIPDAIIAITGRNRLLTDASGNFTAYEVDPGAIVVKAEATGYAASETDGVVQAGRSLVVEFALASLPAPLPAPVTVKGAVFSEKDKPLVATLTATGADVKKSSANGEYQLEAPAGDLVVEASAPGHLNQARRIGAKPGETVIADFVLKEVPKQVLVVLRKEKIEIKKQVHFATNSDVILPDSAALLDQVASTIFDHGNLHLIRI
jgi:outer membrane protein OmpA-like peptidoglycan-associated protein